MKRPRKIATSNGEFILQIPAADRANLLALELHDYFFNILWTTTGWRYQILNL